MPEGTPTTQTEVFESILNRLRQEVDGFSVLTCFVSADPVPMHAPAATFCTVSMSPSRAQAEYFVGGGTDQFTEDANIDVTVFRRWQGEEPNKGEEVILGPSDGLISYWKPAILRALLKDEWRPANDDGYLTRDQLRMVSADKAGRQESIDGAKYWAIGVSFYVIWDWRLD